MKARKAKPKPIARATRGDLHLDRLNGKDLDAIGATRNASCSCACGIGRGCHLCPGCHAQTAEKPGDRRWIAQHIRGGLDSLRERGAIITEIDAIERMAFAMLLGICTDCAQRLWETGSLSLPGDELEDDSAA